MNESRACRTEKALATTLLNAVAQRFILETEPVLITVRILRAVEVVLRGVGDFLQFVCK